MHSRAANTGVLEVHKGALGGSGGLAGGHSGVWALELSHAVPSMQGTSLLPSHSQLWAPTPEHGSYLPSGN